MVTDHPIKVRGASGRCLSEGHVGHGKHQLIVHSRVPDPAKVGDRPANRADRRGGPSMNSGDHPIPTSLSPRPVQHNERSPQEVGKGVESVVREKLLLKLQRYEVRQDANREITRSRLHRGVHGLASKFSDVGSQQSVGASRWSRALQMAGLVSCARTAQICHHRTAQRASTSTKKPSSARVKDLRLCVSVSKIQLPKLKATRVIEGSSVRQTCNPRRRATSSTSCHGETLASDADTLTFHKNSKTAGLTSRVRTEYDMYFSLPAAKASRISSVTDAGP